MWERKKENEGDRVNRRERKGRERAKI